jgi:hypothetical protein
VKDVLIDSILLKNNENLIEDKIHNALTNSDSKEKPLNKKEDK